MRSTTISQTGAKPRIPFFQGLRGFAMLSIFLLHNTVQFNQGYLPASGFSRDFSSLVYTLVPMGVDLFFMISGYLAYAGLMKSERPYFAYVGRRLRRLYPVYLVMLAIYVGLSLVFPEESKFPPGATASVIYFIQNLLMLPGIFNIQPIMAVAWMMSYELFWVLLLPVMITGLHMRSWSRRARVVFWLALAATGLGLFIAFDGPVRLIMFIPGFLLFELLDSGYKSPLPSYTGLAVIPLLCVILALLPVNRVGGAARMAFLFIGLFLLCLDPMLRVNGPTARAFSAAALVAIGNISYSFFLTHGLVIKGAFWAAERAFPPTGGTRDLVLFWIFPLITFIPALVAAVIIYRLVERPFAPTDSASSSTVSLVSPP